MNEQTVLIAIGVVVAAVVLWPLIRRRAGRSAEAAVSPLTPEASEQLAELELDRAMGRVSDEDYARFRGELEAVTSTALAATSEPSHPSSSAPASADAAVARAELLVRHWSLAARPVCPACGVRPEPEAVFCSNCGARLGA